MVITSVVTIFFSCKDNFKEIQKFNQTSFIPSGEADTINLRYTDSGRIKSILKSPKMLDYSSLKFPYTEFPKGLNVTLFDENGSQNFVEADYAISYKKTNIIDLQGNVIIRSNDGKRLETNQLYFDQTNQWFYTEAPYKFTDEQGGYLQGSGVDFSKDFKIFNMQNSMGEVPTK